MPVEPPAKFFVNRGIVSSPSDLYHLLRPLLKQAVRYGYVRGTTAVASGASWVERVVIDRPDISSYFTPLSICINVDSFEYLEFDARPGGLMRYDLVQGDERVVLEFNPTSSPEEQLEAGSDQQSFGLVTDDYVQMELAGFDAGGGFDTGAEGAEPAGGSDASPEGSGNRG